MTAQHATPSRCKTRCVESIASADGANRAAGPMRYRPNLIPVGRLAASEPTELEVD